MIFLISIRKVAVLVTLLLIIGSVFGGTYDEELSKLSSALGSAIEKVEIKTVAMGSLKDLENKDTNLGKLLAEDLSVDLVNQQKGLSVVDRANLNRIMEEYKLTEEGLIDPENTKKLKLAGIDALIFGTITPFEGAYRVALKAIATDTAKVIAATRGSITKTESVDRLMGVVAISKTEEQKETSPVEEPMAPRKNTAPKKTMYNLGDADVEIKSVDFNRRTGKVRILYSVTNKRFISNAQFRYHLIDKNAPASDRGNYRTPQRTNTDYELVGDAIDDKAQSFKPHVPKDADATPSIAKGTSISFALEFDIIIEKGSSIQVPETVTFWFEFCIEQGASIRRASKFFRLSVTDYPIDKVQ